MISLLEYMDGDEYVDGSTWAAAHALTLSLQKRDAVTMALARATQHKREPDNPLAAMCFHRDAHNSDRLPEPAVTAMPAPVGGFPVAQMCHKFGGWGA